MGTYVWQETGFSTAAPATSGALPALTLTAPADAIWKRFLVRKCGFHWAQSVTSVFSIPSVWLEQQVHFIDDHGGDRTIYTTARLITSDVTSLYDTATNERVYTRYHAANDDQVGIDQGVNYGKHTDTGTKSLVYESAIVEPGYGPAFLGAGLYEYQFAALYLTLP
jgi:hypothetical protein